MRIEVLMFEFLRQKLGKNELFPAVMMRFQT